MDTSLNAIEVNTGEWLEIKLGRQPRSRSTNAAQKNKAIFSVTANSIVCPQRLSGLLAISLTTIVASVIISDRVHFLGFVTLCDDFYWFTADYDMM